MTVNQTDVDRPRRESRDRAIELMTNTEAEFLTYRSVGWPDRRVPAESIGESAASRLGKSFLEVLRRLRESRLCSDPSYRLSALVGVLTYLAYGSLNDAWSNAALIGVSVYMYLSTPLYSKISNWMEGAVARRTGLGTGGRVARYLLQMSENLLLLWILIAGQVLSRSGLEGIGGFFATAAWITMVSQGGQYLANWMARRDMGHADRNVVLVISISAIVTALAVSGVTWIQPAYVTISLFLGTAILGAGLVTDARRLLSRNMASIRQ